MHTRFLLSLAAVFLFSGCIQTIAVRSVGGIVEEGFSAFTEETDLKFAEQALPGNLKLLEVMLKNDPENTDILKLLAEGYASYALGWLEDTDVERARAFYLRAQEFGMRILRQDKDIARVLDGSADDLKAVLAKKSKDDVPGVFWTAFAGGSYLNITLTDPAAVASIPRIETMMNFVAEKDSAFYYGGAHLFLGTLYGSRSKFLGGDPDISLKHFQKALRINEGKFLMTQVYFAKSFAAQTLNDTLFVNLLTEVENAPVDILPEFRLGNAIAKQKGKALLARKDDLF